MKIKNMVVVIVVFWAGYLFCNIRSEVEPQAVALEIPKGVSVDGDIEIPAGTPSTCTVDPITGKRTCQPVRNTVKAAATVVGSTVKAAGEVITPGRPASSSVIHTNASSGYQLSYGSTGASVASYGCTGVSYQSVVTQWPVQQQYQLNYGCGNTTNHSVNSYQKTYTRVSGQPVRNMLRRVVGR